MKGAKQPTPNQRSCWVRGWLYCGSPQTYDLLGQGCPQIESACHVPGKYEIASLHEVSCMRVHAFWAENLLKLVSNLSALGVVNAAENTTRTALWWSRLSCHSARRFSKDRGASIWSWIVQLWCSKGSSPVTAVKLLSPYWKTWIIEFYFFWITMYICKGTCSERTSLCIDFICRQSQRTWVLQKWYVYFWPECGFRAIEC